MSSDIGRDSRVLGAPESQDPGLLGGQPESAGARAAGKPIRPEGGYAEAQRNRGHPGELLGARTLLWRAELDYLGSKPNPADGLGCLVVRLSAPKTCPTGRSAALTSFSAVKRAMGVHY